jgi:hypothetical protein
VLLYLPALTIFVLVLKKQPIRPIINIYSVLIGQFWNTRTELVLENFMTERHVLSYKQYYRTDFNYVSPSDLEVKCQGSTKVITVRNTLPYGHAPTYQISLTYLERKKCNGPDKKILFKKQLFDLEVKGHYSIVF